MDLLVHIFFILCALYLRVRKHFKSDVCLEMPHPSTPFSKPLYFFCRLYTVGICLHLILFNIQKSEKLYFQNGCFSDCFWESIEIHSVGLFDFRFNVVKKKSIRWQLDFLYETDIYIILQRN